MFDKEQPRVLIHTKRSCIFCDQLKQALIEMGVSYDEEVYYTGVAPEMYVDGKLVFTGLPSYKILVEYCYKEELVDD